MTETTEGLTRRISSGSDSPCACAGGAAAKKRRARSASHGGSLRFNIAGAFVSKRGCGADFLGSCGEGFNGRNPVSAAPFRVGDDVWPLCRDSRGCQQLYVGTVSSGV